MSDELTHVLRLVVLYLAGGYFGGMIFFRIVLGKQIFWRAIREAWPWRLFFRRR